MSEERLSRRHNYVPQGMSDIPRLKTVPVPVVALIVLRDILSSGMDAALEHPEHGDPASFAEGLNIIEAALRTSPDTSVDREETE